MSPTNRPVKTWTYVSPHGPLSLGRVTQNLMALCQTQESVNPENSVQIRPQFFQLACTHERPKERTVTESLSNVNTSHTHCVSNHFPGELAVTGFLFNSPSPFTHKLRILLGQA